MTQNHKPYVVDRSQGVLIATSNSDKRAVISECLSRRGIRVIHLEELGLASPDETEASFIENAKHKAKIAAKGSGHVAIADDGGFSIAALGGRPGVALRDWASESGDYAPAFARIGRELDEAGIHHGPAWVNTAIGMAWPCGETLAVEGATHGRLIWPPRGKGLDFDPVFAIDGDELSLAERQALVSDPSAVPRRAYGHRLHVVELLLTRTILK